MKEIAVCACGIAAVDCDYHKPAKTLEYGSITISIPPWHLKPGAEVCTSDGARYVFDGKTWHCDH